MFFFILLAGFFKFTLFLSFLFSFFLVISVILVIAGKTHAKLISYSIL